MFGRIDQDTVGLTARLNYTVTPQLSIQLYAQPFVSAGDYSQFKALADGRSRTTPIATRPTSTAAIPTSTTARSGRPTCCAGNTGPGSTLFVVWQQGREDTLNNGDFRFGRDVGGVFDAPAHNVFLVKLAYWLNY